MSIFPLIMFCGFMGICYGMIADEADDGFGVNGTAANATVLNASVPMDGRAKLLADADAAGKDVAVVTALGAMLTTTCGAFLVFCLVRTRVPALYAHRNGEFALKDSFLGWLPQLLSMNEEDLLDCVGFDAFVFLRLPRESATHPSTRTTIRRLQLSFSAFWSLWLITLARMATELACKFCTLGFFPMGLPLMIVNYYADGDPASAGTLKSLTMSNIAPGSWQLCE